MSHRTPPRILIIDDDEDLLEALSIRFRSLGYHCVTAASVEEGLEQFRLGRVDLVITDLMMPPSDGLFLLLTIRKVSTVPIIVISGLTRERPSFLKDFPDILFVSKPVDSESLADLVAAELAAQAGTAIQ